MKKFLFYVTLLSMTVACKSNLYLADSYEGSATEAGVDTVGYIDRIPEKTYRAYTPPGEEQLLKNQVRQYFEESGKFVFTENPVHPKSLIVKSYYEWKGDGTAYFFSLLTLGLLPIRIHDVVELTYSVVDIEEGSVRNYKSEIELAERFSVYERFKTGADRDSLIAKGIRLTQPEDQ